MRIRPQASQILTERGIKPVNPFDDFRGNISAGTGL